MRSHLKFNPNNFELPKKLPSLWAPAPNPPRPYPPSSHVPVLDSRKHNNHPLFSVNTPQTKCPSLFYLLTSCQDWLWQRKILYWIWHTTRKFTNHTYFVSESLKSHQLLQVMAQITIAVHFFFKFANLASIWKGGFNQWFVFWEKFAIFQSVYSSYANLKISNLDAFVALFRWITFHGENIKRSRSSGKNISGLDIFKRLKSRLMLF